MCVGGKTVHSKSDVSRKELGQVPKKRQYNSNNYGYWKKTQKAVSLNNFYSNYDPNVLISCHLDIGCWHLGGKT